jgi:dephospho-CoA kinase
MLFRKLIVAVAGLPGSGKSVMVRAAAERGYAVVVMGDEVREEAKRRRLEATPENMGRIMLELRRLEGEASIARRCIQKIEKASVSRVVVDGVRSLSEVEEFKNHFASVVSVAVHSSPETRFRRLYSRQRSDDPKNWAIFRERDLRELSVGLGNAIAMAEHVIVNEGTLSAAESRAAEVLREIERAWRR